MGEIISRKHIEIDQFKQTATDEITCLTQKIVSDTTGLRCERRFENALKSGRKANSPLCVIAEIKRKSPSAGEIGRIPDPVQLAKRYEAGGAAAISCLTDSAFEGSIEDLRKTAECVKLPVLRKDFIIDATQIAEAQLNGASAVLIMVNVLGKRTAEMVKHCESAGLCALVEVHSQEELDIALKSNARIIGVNARDMKSFTVDLMAVEQLLPKIPDSIVKVAESGIKTPKDAWRMKAAGADAVLVGETLVKAASPEDFIKQASCSSPGNE